MIKTKLLPISGYSLVAAFCLLLAVAVQAASCPYCGRSYGQAAPGDQARVQALRASHEARCPSRYKPAISRGTTIHRNPVTVTAPQQPTGPTASQLNEQGNTAARKGDWNTALSLYRQALEMSPGNDTYKKNMSEADVQIALDRATKARTGRNYQQEISVLREALARHSGEPTLETRLKVAEWDQRREQERTDAVTSIGRKLERFTQILEVYDAPPDFDGKGEGGASAQQRGLDFLPVDESAVPAERPAEPFIDSSVVDLRDAKTLVVDPSRVSGVSPALQSAAKEPKLSRAATALFLSLDAGGAGPAVDPSEAWMQKVADEAVANCLKGREEEREAWPKAAAPQTGPKLSKDVIEIADRIGAMENEAVIQAYRQWQVDVQADARSQRSAGARVVEKEIKDRVKGHVRTLAGKLNEIGTRHWQMYLGELKNAGLLPNSKPTP